MQTSKLKAVVIAAFTFVATGEVLAEEKPRVDPQTPSIIYYGGRLNQQVPKQQYFVGLQGEHLARVEDANRRRTASGFGERSAITGNIRTTYVQGYTRSDGRAVRPYYRSKR